MQAIFKKILKIVVKIGKSPSRKIFKNPHPSCLSETPSRLTIADTETIAAGDAVRHVVPPCRQPGLTQH
jgi:hypothetical protein